MACPSCGCKVHYQFDPGDDLEQTDERMERCAACGAVFDIEDAADDEDDEPAGHVRVIRFCEGGERVINGVATSACDYCSGGVCRQMQACERSAQEQRA